MLNYNSPIKVSKNYSEINITEVEPTAKINLRGKSRDFITKIGKELSIIPPTEPNTSAGNEDFNIIWLSPDEWMLYSNDKIDLKTIIIEGEKNNTPYTNKDKFKKMLSDNPNLEKLRIKLGLDPDY